MSAPHEHVFFADRDLGKQFPDMLEKALIHVEKHGDHFADDAKDEDWLKEISQRGWYVLTHDQRMRYRPNEMATIEKFKIGLFVLVGKAPMAELAQNFIFTFRQIIKFIEENPRPFIAKIYRPDQTMRKTKPESAGSVKLWVSF